MNTSVRLIWRFVFFQLSLTLCVLLTSCDVESPAQLPQPTTVTIKRTTVPAQTTLPTQTPKPTASPSPTVSPTISETSILSATPTWTPVPTLVPDAVRDIVAEYMLDNDECRLPCWWGITPGITTWAEARTKLGSLARVSGPRGEGGTQNYEFEIMLYGNSGVEHRIFLLGVRDEIVVGVNVSGSLVSATFEYSLPAVLDEFGLPNQIWVTAVTDTPDEYERKYTLSLYYQNVGIYYTMAGAIRVDGEQYFVCPVEHKSRSFPTAFILVDPILNLRHEGIWYSGLGIKYRGDPWIHLLEEHSVDFTTLKFYETYLNPNSEICFEIVPKDL